MKHEIPNGVAAYKTLYDFENNLRIFVFLVLKKALKTEWKRKQIVLTGKEKQTIEQIGKQHRKEMLQYGHLGRVDSCPVIHLTLDQLFKIILEEKTWPFFRPFFSTKRVLLSEKFREITLIRNQLSHFRKVTDNNLRTLSEMLETFFALPKSYVVNSYNCNFPVSLEDDWIKYFPVTKSIDYYSGAKFNLPDFESCSIQLNYTSEVVGDSVGCREVTTIDSINLLKNPKYSKILESLSYSYEFIDSWVTLCDDCEDPLTYDGEIEVIKSIDFIFPKKHLVENGEEIGRGFKVLLKQIQEETTNLRKGIPGKKELVSSERVEILSEGGILVVDTKPMNSQRDTWDPCECWGHQHSVMVSTHPGDLIEWLSFPWS